MNSQSALEVQQGADPEYTTEQLLLAFEEKEQEASQALIDAYASQHVGQDERRKAAIHYVGIVMAHHGLLYQVHHRADDDPPQWLEFARADLTSRTEDDVELRKVLDLTPIFNDNPQVQRRLHAAVSASFIPGGNHDCYELANGLITERITIDPL